MEKEFKPKILPCNNPNCDVHPDCGKEFNLSEKRKKLRTLIKDRLEMPLMNELINDILNEVENQDKEFIKRLTPKLFHEIYEEEAEKIGWETHRKCRVKFDDLPELNQLTMINTLRRIKLELAGKDLYDGKRV